jgi:hypothetical protein
MALGKLTFYCVNFMFLGTVSILLIWILMQMRVRQSQRPRIYSEPPVSPEDSYPRTG